MNYRELNFKVTYKELGKGMLTLGDNDITFKGKGNVSTTIPYTDIERMKKQSYAARIFWYVITFTFSAASRTLTVITADGKEHKFKFASLRKLKKASKALKPRVKNA